MEKHKQHHGGRYDDPHGVTADSHLSVGRYLGNVGERHFYSAESTGGGETDSISLSHPQRHGWKAPDVGSHVVIDTRIGAKGYSNFPKPYDPARHGHIKGAPQAE